MGLSATHLADALNRIAAADPAVRAALDQVGLPPPRQRPPGPATLIRTIVGQQVSVAAAGAILGRLEALVGAGLPLAGVSSASDEALREVGLSRQKIGYLRSLADAVGRGLLALDALPSQDDLAIEALVQVRGVGRWSAEVYLLFAEGRPDIWPAGDLAVQAALAAMLRLPARPGEAETRRLGERWRPHRGAMALFAWHLYNTVPV